ncbi:hypothetical protein [Streptomyces sp. NPDC093094]|uniref:hypothetical protein n=1 Tax=Streptomyces sp. NPDC093094 TaxID=3366026 RepID=UPI00382863C2
MSTDRFRFGARAPAPGALLLCRADPGAVAAVAPLLREPALLAPAGDGWSVLVPEGRPWLHGGEPVDEVVAGWAAALAVGAPWPVLALWWDADRGGCTLASGFRRAVGYVWLADGTPAGEGEAMRTFAARLGLDPVLDVEALDLLTRPDAEADVRARVRGLIAVLTRAGVDLPAGLGPGESADRLREAARSLPGVRRTGRDERHGAVRAEPDVMEDGPARPFLPPAGGPAARLLAPAQVAAGLSLLGWGACRRSGGWAVAGAVLLAHGALGLARDAMRPRD